MEITFGQMQAYSMREASAVRHWRNNADIILSIIGVGEYAGIVGQYF